jgi:nitroreductase
MNNSIQQINTIIRSRKSTFTNGLKPKGKISDDVILEILENATWAPSHGLVQPWYFKVFTGKGINNFFTNQQRIYKETTSAEKFNELKYKKYTEKVDIFSHIITIICKRDPKRRFPKQEDIVSVACAVENIYLSLNAYGIGGYLSTGDICYTKPMREFLNLGEEDECIGFFMLGLPDESFTPPARKRIAATEKTEWVRE